MNERRRLSLIVGVFALFSAVTAAIILASLGSDAGLLKERYSLVTYFQDVQGLVPGAPVRLAGKDIGRVKEVSFAPLEEDHYPVRVLLEVNAEVKDRIRSDSTASVGTIGLLGDKYVAVTMGSSKGEVLEDESELPSLSPVDLNIAMVRGTEAIDNIARLASNANAVIEGFMDSAGVGQIAAVTSGVANVVEEVQGGSGLLHHLIYQPYEGKELESLGRSLAEIEAILNEIENGDGVLHDLIYEPANEELIGKALSAGSRLESILAKIDEGNGTMALLVNDPSLYQDLKVLVGGARRSKLVRTLVELSVQDDE